MVWASLVFGKSLGIYSLTRLGIACGFPLPRGIATRDVLLLGLIASCGLTVSTFIAGQVYSEEEAVKVQSAPKLGALLTVLSVPMAIVISRLGNFKKKETEE